MAARQSCPNVRHEAQTLSEPPLRSAGMPKALEERVGGGPPPPAPSPPPWPSPRSQRDQPDSPLPAGLTAGVLPTTFLAEPALRVYLAEPLLPQALAQLRRAQRSLSWPPCLQQQFAASLILFSSKHLSPSNSLFILLADFIFSFAPLKRTPIK